MQYRSYLNYLIFCLILLGFSGTSFAAQALEYQIIGIKGDLLKNVISRLQIQQESHAKTITAKHAQRYFRQGQREIKAALEPFGYFRAQVEPVQLTVVRGHWRATYHVKLGAGIKIVAIDLRITGPGQHDKRFQHVLKHFPIKRGQIFSAVRYALAKQTLLDLANHRGYFKALMEKTQVIINLVDYSVRITLHFKTGPRFRFGQVKFSPVPFKEKFLKRYITFKPGRYYNQNRLNEMQEHLINSNYFSEVIVKPDLDHIHNDRVPILVTLKPVKAQQYKLGAGFGTDTGFRGLLGINFPRVTQTGQKFSTTLHLAQRQSQAQASYIIPGRNPVTDKYTINASYLTQDLVSGKAETQQIGFNYITQVKRWQQTLGIKVMHEFSQPKRGPNLTTTMLIPHAQWLYVSARNRITARKGTLIQFMIQGASRSILANTNFAQVELHIKRLQPLNHYQRLVLRTTLGYTLINNINDLPFTLQFYTGGANAVRGYEYNSIGPGKFLAVGSIEFQQKVYKQFYLTTFYDVGNASNDLFENYNQGLGVGILWRSPVGDIEVSLTKALDKAGKPLMVQLSMGPAL